MYEFKMPSLSSEMTHGKLLEWNIKVGDKVNRHDIIAIVDTDKAAIEIESFGEGIVKKLLVNPGEKVPVGTTMALIQEETFKKKEQPSSPQTPHVASIRISPLARKLAGQLAVDVAKIKGSGADGAIVESDIRKYAAGGPFIEDHTISMKKAIAAAMVKSKREIPHYYLSCEIDLNKALTWLEKYNSTHSITERILYIALLIKGVVRAIEEFPDFNGFVIDNEFKSSASIHIGIAISLHKGGLIPPALLNTDKMSLIEIMQNLTDLVTRARTGKLRGSEISNPTITITNLGELGADTVFGVIYPPQVALVGFGKISLRRTITATLSADHRVTNGHLGSAFLSAINNFLQEPEKL